jgi:DNA-binding CsgD family transcriptional regulator
MGALGRVRVRRGDPGGREVLEEALEIGKGNEIQHIWSPTSGLAEYHWLRGSDDKIQQVLGAHYHRALATDSEWARGELGYWMWKLGAIDGPPTNAAEPFALQISGKWQEAGDAWLEIGCPYEVGLSLFESGEPKPMLEALETFDSLGARPMSDRVRAELRQLGVESIPRGPARSTRENPAGLTNRQVEVLELIAGGLSNAEIADQLFISKKTVEHHVSAIFTKLGVGSREEAVAATSTDQEPPLRS